MDNSALLDKKIEYLIDMRVNKLKNELSEAMTTIANLTTEVDTLKNKVQRLNTSAAPIGQEPQTTLESAPEKAEAAANGAPNARTGSITADEVSVEKMFYFGKK